MRVEAAIGAVAASGSETDLEFRVLDVNGSRTLVQRQGAGAARRRRPAGPHRRHDAGDVRDGGDRAPHAPAAGGPPPAPRRGSHHPASGRRGVPPHHRGRRAHARDRTHERLALRRVAHVHPLPQPLPAQPPPAHGGRLAGGGRLPGVLPRARNRPRRRRLGRAPRPAHHRARGRLSRAARHRRDARGADPPRRASGRRRVPRARRAAAPVADRREELRGVDRRPRRDGARRRRARAARGPARAQRGALSHLRQPLDRGDPARGDLAAGLARGAGRGAGRAHPPARRRRRGERVAREAPRRRVAAAAHRPHARVAGPVRRGGEGPDRVDPRRLPVQRVRDRPRRRRRRDALAPRLDDRRHDRRPAGRAVEHLAEHHPAQGSGAGARVPGPPRSAHRPAEPQVARRTAGRGARGLAADRRGPRADDDGPRPLQGDQRLARPLRRRPAAQADRPAPPAAARAPRRASSRASAATSSR